MKIGLAIGYSGAHLDVPIAFAQCAEELGYDSFWSAEAYGSDDRSATMTTLSWRRLSC